MYEVTRYSRAFDAFIFVNRLHPGILTVLSEDETLRDELTNLLPQARNSRRSKEQPGHPLTRREDEVYSLLAEGRSNREIASALFISEPTVKVHVRHILRKLGARSRTEAAIQAVRKQQPQGLEGEDREQGS